MLEVSRDFDLGAEHKSLLESCRLTGPSPNRLQSLPLAESAEGATATGPLSNGR